MDIKQENIIAAYETATESGKSLLQALFPDLSLGQTQQPTDNRPITERIKTWEDACLASGNDPQAYEDWLDDQNLMPDERAYLKLHIIVSVLNEGWVPKFTANERRWYPWFLLWTADELSDKSERWREKQACLNISAKYEGDYCGFAFADSYSAPSSTSAYLGSRLCLRSEALSDYCGKQFNYLWADFMLIRK